MPADQNRSSEQDGTLAPARLVMDGGAGAQGTGWAGAEDAGPVLKSRPLLPFLQVTGPAPVPLEGEGFPSRTGDRTGPESGL